MSRPKRCHFQGAIHLLTVNGYSGGHVFYDSRLFKQFPENPRLHAEGATRFEALLWNACAQYDARVHAYFIESNTARIVIQTLGAPLSWLVHDVLAQYSRYLIGRKSIPHGSKAFPRRYKAQIVQPAKLPYVVRHIQRIENGADRHRRAIKHLFTSHLIYCDRRSSPEYFVVSAMRNALVPLGYLGPNAYSEFMTASDSPSIAHMLSRRVIGERTFADSVQGLCRKRPQPPSPDEILREVANAVLHTRPDVVFTSTHLGALARALVAWYAMRTGTARIGAVARWFGVTSADLGYLIRRHRRRNPHYFSKSLTELFPGHTSQPPVPDPAPGRISAHRTVALHPPSAP